MLSIAVQTRPLESLFAVTHSAASPWQVQGAPAHAAHGPYEPIRDLVFLYHAHHAIDFRKSLLLTFGYEALPEA